MKVSTVSIVMAILCTLSSWRSAEGHDTIAVAVNSSSAIAVSKGPDATGPKAVVPQPSTPQISTPKPSTPSNGGGSSGSNGENPETDKIETTTMSYAQWKEEEERKLDEKYEGLRRGDQDRAINSLASSIQSALAKPGLSAAKQADLNFAYNLLMKATADNDASVEKAAYDEALHILTNVLSMLDVGTASLC
ncbi:uncharacterized protein LOC105233797 isoform X5 [Bactrocera dorsalis]|uniref:Uncharacterized protein LOC105233797 isoform X5 n=1 Tax=Bactrocera dorsalis TaxID=27457 RepID=A0ABM3J2B8_BACDO|nr:uncharacterized protein LOC105233797 isoform X5 [Bactrocera dorsalis]XP_049303372.1 uncharacterized protein LOC105233797 isoform X5 [Bactrocera dorsalis]